MEIADIYLEYIDDNEGLAPQDWICQYDLTEEEKDYFFTFFN